MSQLRAIMRGRRLGERIVALAPKIVESGRPLTAGASRFGLRLTECLAVLLENARQFRPLETDLRGLLQTASARLRPKTIDRYILREICIPVALSIAVVALALVVVNLLKLTDLVVNHGASAGEVLHLLYCLMPSVVEQTLPLAMLIGVLLGVGRMSGDQELIAARACGMSLYRLAAPVMIFAALLCPFALMLTMRVTPQANARMRGLIMELTRTSGTWAVSEKVFNRTFPGITLYFDRLEQPGSRLSNVLVSDQRNPSSPSVIVAKSAVLIPRADQPSMTLRMHDGWIFGANQQDDNQHFVRFSTYDVDIALSDVFSGPRKVSELSMADLHTAIEVAPRHHNVWAETEIARRWTVTAALIPFAILGMMLGLTRVRGGRYERMVFALGVFFLYYVLLRTGEAIAQAGSVNAYLVVGAPDVLLTLAAVLLFRIGALDLDNPGELLSAWVRRTVAAKLDPA